MHVNGIESFWSFTKRRMAQFDGVKANFMLHLKERKWRRKKSFPPLQEELNVLYRDFKKRKILYKVFLMKKYSISNQIYINYYVNI